MVALTALSDAPPDELGVFSVSPRGGSLFLSDSLNVSRKRKKNKGNPAGGSNPSNDLYDHPSVVAARGRKDANTPGGEPKKSKPRRSRWDVDFLTLLALNLAFFNMTINLSRVQVLWVTVFALIVGALTGLLFARLARTYWDINLALRAAAAAALFVVIVV